LKYLIKLIFAIFFLSVPGCGLGEWDLSLYEQKIEGTSKALYKYDAWGGRDTHLFGYTILDTTQKFDIYKRNELSIHLLTEIPEKNLILAMETLPNKKDELEIHVPIKTDQTKIGKISIKTDYYQSKGYSQKARGYVEMEFDSFIETRDSIFFYDLNEFTHMNTGHLDSLKIKKGNVYIARKALNDTILRISIDNLIISNDGRKSLISNVKYNLKPKYPIDISEFSNYGIFKSKNTMPNTVYN